MALTNKQKHQLRWEAIDGAFSRWEQLSEEQGGAIEYEDAKTDEELQYMREAISAMARRAAIDDHMYLI